jgi:site-specific DNA-methyltransferase (adenine-specific)
MIKLLHGDCRALLARMEAESVDAVVTDPPYGLGFMGKEFDKLGEGEAQEAFHRTWARELLRVLKPGGHVIAFGGTRTYHWLAAALEKEGFEIRDMVSWAYGSGFPKSLDVGKAIDKIDRLGPMRERALAFTAWMRGTGITVAKVNAVTGTFMGSHYLTDKEQPAVPTEELFDLLRPHLPPVPAEIEALVTSRTVESENMRRREVVGSEVRHNEPSGIVSIGQGERVLFERQITLPHTEAAQRWHGWGTALKPAVEPAVLARKPLAGTVAANVLTHGTGALNVDGCRVGEESAPGRWPANLIHDGSDDVVGLFPPGRSAGNYPSKSCTTNEIYGERKGQQGALYADTGSAARFSLPPRCLAFRFGPPCCLVLRARAGHTLACGLRAFHGLPRRWLARTAAAVGVSLVAGPERRLPPVRHPGLGWAGEPWLSGAPTCVLRSVQEHAASASRGSTRGIATLRPALRCDIVHVVRPVCRLLRACARLPPTSPSLG